jgi:hypothetical protein
MLIFNSPKLVYFATPKSGSSAIQRGFGRLADSEITAPSKLKHMRPARFFNGQFEGMTSDLAQQYQGIAVVRDPLERLGSYYRYRQRPELAENKNSTIGITFDAFITEYMKPERRAFASIGTQANFLTGGDGLIEVKHLFAYERLDYLVAFLNARLQSDIELPVVNASPRLPLPLQKMTEERLKTHLAADYALYERALNGALEHC